MQDSIPKANGYLSRLMAGTASKEDLLALLLILCVIGTLVGCFLLRASVELYNQLVRADRRVPDLKFDKAAGIAFLSSLSGCVILAGASFAAASFVHRTGASLDAVAIRTQVVTLVLDSVVLAALL